MTVEVRALERDGRWRVEVVLAGVAFVAEVADQPRAMALAERAVRWLDIASGGITK